MEDRRADTIGNALSLTVGWLVGSGLTAHLAQKGYIVPGIIQN